MISSAAEAAGSGKTCPWGGQDAVPFKYVCQHLTEAAAHDEQHLVTHLAQLVIDIWQHAPADLVSLVCLVRDQILSPTLEGVELLPAAALPPSPDSTQSACLSAVTTSRTTTS